MSRYIDNPENLRNCRLVARRTAEIFQLPLRHKVWSGGSGDFMGQGTGSSLDFQDHRTYVPGDDPRHINWQAYARTGQYSLKLYREEVRPVVDVVFDASGSAFCTEEKAQRSVELFYFCAESAQKCGASLQTFLVQGERVVPLSADMLAGDAWPSLISQEPEPYPPAPPALPKIPLRAQSLRIFVSDLLFPGAAEPAVRSLVARQGRAMLLAPYSRQESQVDWEGNYEFVDAESGTKHPRRVEPRLVQRYQEAYGRHFSLWSTTCRRYGAVLGRVPAEISLADALKSEALAQGMVEL